MTILLNDGIKITMVVCSRVTNNFVSGVSVVSLDKSLEVNHISAKVGDNVEIKCDVTGTPPPPLVWRKNDADLEGLSEQEVRLSSFAFSIPTYCHLFPTASLSLSLSLYFQVKQYII